MFVIRINSTAHNGFFRQIAEVELAAGTKDAAREMFSLFCEKFPAPTFALSLTHRTTAEPVIGTSENY